MNSYPIIHEHCWDSHSRMPAAATSHENARWSHRRHVMLINGVDCWQCYSFCNYLKAVDLSILSERFPWRFSLYCNIGPTTGSFSAAVSVQCLVNKDINMDCSITSTTNFESSSKSCIIFSDSSGNRGQQCDKVSTATRMTCLNSEHLRSYFSFERIDSFDSLLSLKNFSIQINYALSEWICFDWISSGSLGIKIVNYHYKYSILKEKLYVSFIHCIERKVTRK